MIGRRIVIAGGGVGALEAALALRAYVGTDADVILVSPDSHFTYRPLAVGEPFGLGGAIRYDLSTLGREGDFEVRRAAVESVELEKRALQTTGGLIAYDSLILATGARPLVGVERATTFDGPPAIPGIAQALRDLAERDHGRVAFIAPDGVPWTLPLYELAFLTQAWAKARSIALDVVVATAEPAPLAAIGPAGSKRLASALAEREITVRPSLCCRAFRDRRVIHDHGDFRADVAIALPTWEGPRIAGVARDRLGFIPVNALGKVPDSPDVYAIGDCANHPIKQGGLATQQAALAAREIAFRMGVAPTAPLPTRPVLRAMVLTGDEPLWLVEHVDDTMRAPAESGIGGPWWPPQKIAGRFLGPFLLTHGYLAEPPLAAPDPALPT